MHQPIDQSPTKEMTYTIWEIDSESGPGIITVTPQFDEEGKGDKIFNLLMSRKNARLIKAFKAFSQKEAVGVMNRFYGWE